MLAQNANQLFKAYRKAGGSLSFKAWIEREKEKQFSADGDSEAKAQPFILNDTLAREIAAMQKQGAGTVKTSLNKHYAFGLPTWIWWTAGGAVATVAIVYLVKKKP